MSKKFRIGVLGIIHESNTFLDGVTDLEDFRLLRTGEEFRAYSVGKHNPTAAFFKELAETDIEAVPLIIASASPAGQVTDRALDHLWAQAEELIAAAGPLDGLLVSLHGAGVNESRPDMDGWLLTQMRRVLGPDRLLFCTLDPHANLSPAMVDHCDAVLSYRENPHLDSYQRGEELARLMIRTLHGEVRPVVAGAFPPVAINIERQHTGSEPLRSVITLLDEVRSRPGILSVSVNFGFPYADVREMGTSFLVVADEDKTLAQSCADELATWLLENRERFRGEMITPEEAIKRARTMPAPVGLLDMGDNIGGGSCADSTVLAHLCQQADNLRSFIFLMDAESAAAAREAGVGSRITLRMGGKTADSPAPPVEAEVTVVSLHDGAFEEREVRHGGRALFDMGPTAVVRTDRGLTVMLGSRRCEPYSLQQLLVCGINPEDFDVIIIKGVHAPLGGYASVCPAFIRVNTPGVTTADMDALTYHHRRKPLFPFEEVA